MRVEFVIGLLLVMCILFGIQFIGTQSLEEKFQIERPKSHHLIPSKMSDLQQVFDSVFDKIGEIFRYIKSFLELDRENEIKLVFSVPFYISIFVFSVHLLRSFKENKSSPVFPVKMIGSEVPLWFWTIFSKI